MDATRLHITPLDADLINIILPAAVHAQARNVSFHTIPTFPEKRYGFVDLPVMEAEKLKKKLNGSTLKGTKVRVETARPESITEPRAAAEEAPKRKKSEDSGVEGSKKRKRDIDVIEGIQLHDRKVKRGWTVADNTKKKDKKSKPKKEEKQSKREVRSKYTDKEECLFKTKLPPNVPAGKAEASNKKKRNKGKSRGVVVHEFENTTKFPTFLKDTATESAEPATEYVEGKGWINEDGTVVEEAHTRRSTRSRAVAEEPAAGKQEAEDDTSSSGTSSGAESSAEDSEQEGEIIDSDADQQPLEAGGTVLTKPPVPPFSSPVPPSKADSRPKSSSSTKSLTIKIPPVTPIAGKVHPLEALYKRSKPTDGTPSQQPAAEPFSFFDEEDGADQDPVVTKHIPMTPYTREDFEWRNIRSAAPTPDTAHPNKRVFWASQDGEEDDEEDDGDGDRGYGAPAGEDNNAEGESAAAESTGEQAAPTSDFQKYFWENRADLNRSWMKRRKTAKKEKRYKDNKARASRGA